MERGETKRKRIRNSERKSTFKNSTVSLRLSGSLIMKTNATLINYISHSLHDPYCGRQEEEDTLFVIVHYCVMYNTICSLHLTH